MIGGAEDADKRFDDKDSPDKSRDMGEDVSIHGQGGCNLFRSDKEISRRGRHTKAEERVCRHERTGRPVREDEHRSADINRWAYTGVKEGMSSSKTKVRTIRIKNETADFFKDKPLNKVVENVHDLAKKKDLEVSENGDILLSRR